MEENAFSYTSSGSHIHVTIDLIIIYLDRQFGTSEALKVIVQLVHKYCN